MAGPGLTAAGQGAGRPARRALIVAVLVGLAALLVFIPSLPAMCPVRLLFHLPCPSCGLTRATRLAVEGDFAGATHMHPLWFVVLPFVGAVGAWELGHYLVRGVAAPLPRGFVPAACAVIALLLLVWIARFLGAFGGPAPV